MYYQLLPPMWRRKMEENIEFNCMTAGLQGIVEYAEHFKTLELRFDPNCAKNDKKRAKMVK